MIQKLVSSESTVIKSRINLAFVAVVLIILSLLLGFILGRNSIQTTSYTNIETPSEDQITTRKSIQGKVTAINDSNFVITNETSEYTILTNSDTIFIRGTLELEKDVILTVLQTGDTYLAEKIRVI